MSYHVALGTELILLETVLLLVSAVPLNRINCWEKQPFVIENGAVKDGKYYVGDMILTKAQLDELEHGPESRNGLLSATKRWPNSTVVYYIEDGDFDEEQKKKIYIAMNEISKVSCIKFKKTSKEKRMNSVTIKGQTAGCSSSVGYWGNSDENEAQIIRYSPKCFGLGTLIHEILHTLGFYHMQSSSNRDDFIKIIWENVKEGKEFNFIKYANDTITDFGVPYDYSSVMHYSSFAFSKNKKATIIPLKEEVKIGQRIGLSEGDIIKLNKMYCEQTQEEDYTRRHLKEHKI